MLQLTFFIICTCMLCTCILLQCVSVSSSEFPEKSDVDLDDLMKTYAHALQREINVTDTVGSVCIAILTFITVLAGVEKLFEVGMSLVIFIVGH